MSRCFYFSEGRLKKKKKGGRQAQVLLGRRQHVQGCGGACLRTLCGSEDFLVQQGVGQGTGFSGRRAASSFRNGDCKTDSVGHSQG